MKKSIKWKLTIAFIVIIVCCIGSIILFNTLFLEKFYIFEKKTVLTNTYNVLNDGIIEAYNNGYTLSDLFKRNKNNGNANSESNFILFLRELQDNYGVNIVLMDKNNKVYSLFQNNNRFDKRIMNYIFKDAVNDENLQILEKNDNYTIAINTPRERISLERPSTDDKGPNEYYESEGPSTDNTKKNVKKPSLFVPAKRNANIECFGFLSDKETAFFMLIPVASIKESVTLFNKVLLLCSIFVLIVGSVVIFIVSNNITRPLLELSEIAKKMSRLEFENKYNVKTEDEIGTLGNAINEMNTKLEKAVKELKNVNYKLKKDIEQKEQLDLMRQEFVANVSHELKTPIALIQGYAEGLETEGIVNDKESRDYYINVIKDETERMNHMVRELLDLSALERGMAELDIERINLSEAVDGIVKSQEIKIKEKEVSISVDINKEVYVWADGFKLEEVVRNYLTNAINHVDDNKIVKIYTKDLGSDKLRLYVYNSGVKLSKEEQEKIWEKFYKVDKAHSREYGGTGLGLSIVKAIANQHNTSCGCEAFDENTYFKDGMAFYFDFSIK